MAAITYDLKTKDGKDIDAIRNVIALRKKELGETTKQACTAIAINCLKSLRANTRVAKETGIKIDAIDVTSRLTPSWKRQGKFSVRVFRNGINGQVVRPEIDKVQWLVKAGDMVNGVQCRTFLVTDKISNDYHLQIIFVATDKKQAVDAMKQIHKVRVRRYKRLAKYALGIAMHKTHAQQNANDTGITQLVNQTANDNTRVTVTETGFGNGEVNIHIEDNLDYAAEALKNGPSYVDIAMRKALNQITGNIIHKLKQNGNELYNQISVPFPELKGR